MTDFADISHWNGNVNFPDLKRHSPFVIIKASQGSGGVDPAFHGNWTAAKAAGLARGAYHFGVAGTDPIACARGLHSLAPDAELPLVLDREVDPATHTIPTVDWAAKFLTECDRLTGRTSILYTGHTNLAESGPLTRWLLWVARYRSTLGSVAPWGSAWAWQYTQTGSLGAHRGDVSHLYGEAPRSQPKDDEVTDADLLRIAATVEKSLKDNLAALDARANAYATNAANRAIREITGHESTTPNKPVPPLP